MFQAYIHTGIALQLHGIPRFLLWVGVKRQIPAEAIAEDLDAINGFLKTTI